MTVQGLTLPCILAAAKSALPPGAAQASRTLSPACGSSRATTMPADSSCTCKWQSINVQQTHCHCAARSIAMTGCNCLTAQGPALCAGEAESPISCDAVTQACTPGRGPQTALPVPSPPSGPGESARQVSIPCADAAVASMRAALYVYPAAGMSLGAGAIRCRIV